MSNYRTFANYRTFDFTLEIKRSEFIGYAQRVDSKEQADQFVESIRLLHPDARHVCWAYVLGERQQVQRSTDDGEPAGTAGVPILQTILKNSDAKEPLSDVVSVVVRYFGGVLLGAGGLVRAYSEASAKTLEKAPVITRSQQEIYIVRVPFERAGKVENLFRQHGNQPLDTTYGSQEVELDVPFTSRELLEQLQLNYELKGARWVDST